MTAQHIVQFRAAAARRSGTRPSNSDYPFDAWKTWREHRRAIALRLRPSRRRLDLMSALATGALPWGVTDFFRDPKPCLSLCGHEYILCCGHALRRAEAQHFVDAGLLEEGPLDWDARPSLVITGAGRDWLSTNWTRSPWRGGDA